MTDLEMMCEKYYKYVNSYALSLCCDETLAEDITQETFCNAIKNIDSFKGNCQIETWLCSIARNVFLNFKRQKTTENIDDYTHIASEHKYRASITNDDTSKSFSFSTYQLSEYLVRMGLVNLIDGEMIDFNKQNKDYIEILVTEDFGAGINEELYFTVNGLDENYKQVVVKAKIVGIVEKGSFLYGYHEYCGDNRTPETLHEIIFDSETVFTGDISYLYEYEAEPNSLLDEEVPVFLLGVKKSLNNSTINALVTANNGSEVTQYATRINNESVYSALNISYGILVGSVIAIIIILIADIVLIKKILKKDEDCVISEH